MLAIISPIMLALFLGVILVGLIALSFPSLEYRLRLWLKARNDYKTTRGTMHLRLLHGCLGNLRLKIKETKADLEETKKYKERLTGDRKKELEVAATTYLVKLEFINIPGIGPALIIARKIKKKDDLSGSETCIVNFRIQPKDVLSGLLVAKDVLSSLFYSSC